MTASVTGDSATEVIDAGAVASLCLSAFADALSRGEAAAVAELFQPDGYWRDHLSFTWDLRTLRGHEAITGMLADRLTAVGPGDFRLDRPDPLIQPLDERRQLVQ